MSLASLLGIYRNHLLILLIVVSMSGSLVCNSWLVKSKWMRPISSSFFAIHHNTARHSTATFHHRHFSALHDSTSTTNNNRESKNDKSAEAGLMNFANSTKQSILICGPSGVGKGTLITRLLQEYPADVALSVSRTSRCPRAGEVEGVHYYFVHRSDLEKDIQMGQWPYLEHAEVHGNLYGTRLDAVYAIHAQGKLCLLDLDTRGAQQLQAKKFPMHSLFIAPPSLETLASRLSGRNSETSAQQELRLQNARAEIVYGTQPGHFDTILVNDNIEETYQGLVSQLRTWFPTYFQSSNGDSK